MTEIDSTPADARDFFKQLAVDPSVGTVVQLLSDSAAVDAFTVANGRITFDATLRYTIDVDPHHRSILVITSLPSLKSTASDGDSSDCESDGKDEDTTVGDTSSDNTNASDDNDAAPTIHVNPWKTAPVKGVARAQWRSQLVEHIGEFCRLAQGVRGYDGTISCTRQPSDGRKRSPCVNLHNGFLCPFVHRDAVRHAKALKQIIDGDIYKKGPHCPYGDECLWMSAPVMCPYRHFTTDGGTDVNARLSTLLSEIATLLNTK